MSKPQSKFRKFLGAAAIVLFAIMVIGRMINSGCSWNDEVPEENTVRELSTQLLTEHYEKIFKAYNAKATLKVLDIKFHDIKKISDESYNVILLVKIEFEQEGDKEFDTLLCPIKISYKDTFWDVEVVVEGNGEIKYLSDDDETADAEVRD